MRAIGIAHLTLLSQSPPELVSAAATAGLDFVGLRVAPATPGERVYPMDVGSPLLAETVRRLASTGIRVADIEVVQLDRTSDRAVWLPVLETGAALGASYLTVGARDGETEFLTDAFAALVADAKPYGIRPLLEPITYRPVNTLPQALAIVTASEGGGVLVDALHFQRFGGRLEQITGADPALFPFAQVCDGPIAAPTAAPPGLALARGQRADGPLQAEARAMRAMPGAGEFPLAELITALPDGIPLSVEAPVAGFTDTAPAHVVAARAREAMVRVLHAAGRAGR